ncbi:hypothetical protein HMPREF9123_0467 [Neisseria bacilliformis ATCC BAA-1200]|uniref:Uncharacterized protein n=1 Tax=Neisseria bacilliformis ATCC BAA-1200 TaxID=888742 RepID=F2B9P4_9NEIS|nr:hypothetical protein HMPREF9123_0467 [Neisseria bacilliformis ATCC BAA-1200]
MHVVVLRGCSHPLFSDGFQTASWPSRHDESGRLKTETGLFRRPFGL